MVRGPSPGPAPADQARASSSRLTRSNWRPWPHQKLRRNVRRQEGPQGGWRLDRAAQHTIGTASPQRVGVVNAVAPSQRRGHQDQHLVARVRTPRRISQVNVAVNQLGQTQALGQGDRQEQPSIGHQTVIVKGDLDAVGLLKW